MKNILFFSPLLFCLSLSAQKHDYIWPLGYGNIHHGSNGISVGGILMDFSTTPPSFSLHDFLCELPQSGISDKEGHLLAYTDGCHVYNREHTRMLNGDTLNPGEVFVEFCPASGGYYPLWQSSIFLPQPGNDSLYYLFHLRDDNWYWNPMNLMYSVINAHGDNYKGAVITKNNIVLSDSIYLGNYVTATRHANGRDWWVAVPRRHHSEMHLSLLTPDTVQYMGMQDVGFVEVDSAYCCGQTCFSPDGRKYFRSYPEGLLILDFDRCSGIFSNPVYLDHSMLPLPPGGGGVAVSSNGRFLYMSAGYSMQQYDLWASDFAASRQIVATYDDYLSPFPTYFFQAMPAPDGRIYTVTTNSNNVLHVIHYPNRLGLSCLVEQHGVKLPALTDYLIPNFPNYRLGSIDGSPCDTLGIDNLPIAHFRWDLADTLWPQQVAFTDLSYYEPATWFWDFGDGTTSQDTSPLHLYLAPGIYTVCLTVCNSNACDTICQEVEVEAVGTVTLQGEGGQVLLWPNPVVNILHLQLESPIESIRILDAKGQDVSHLAPTVSDEQVSVDVQRLLPGLYFLSLRAGQQKWSGKFLKGG